MIPPPRARPVGSLAVLALLVAVLAYQTWLRFSPAVDFSIYLAAADAFWAGDNPYATATPVPFLYPLFLCVVLWPLTHVPLGLAAVVWFAASAAALGWALVLILRLAGPFDAGRAVKAVAYVLHDFWKVPLIHEMPAIGELEIAE